MNPRLVIYLLVTVFLAQAGWGKTVGLWKVAPLYVNDTMVKTLSEAGWKIVTMGSTNLTDAAVLEGLDVIFLPGGWDVYRLAGFRVRRNLVRFVAGGKGILDTDVATSKRPLFPQVGITGEYLNQVHITVSGTHELAAILGERLLLTNGCCYQVKTGSQGRVFAVSGNDSVGVCGEIYGGRYVLFSYSPLVDANNMQKFVAPTLGVVQPEASEVEGEKAVIPKRLPAFLDWLAAAPKLSAAEKTRQQAQADLEFLRQEMRGDWIRNEDSFLGNLSLVPEIRRRLARPVEKRLFTLGELSRSLSGENLDRCRALSNELQQTMGQLEGRYQELRSNIEVRIQQMAPAELTEDNPFVAGAGVLKRIEATPAKTEAEKAEIIALVNCCFSTNPPPDVSQSVALYCHGQEVAEQMMSQARLSELTNRWDKAIRELQVAAKAPALNVAKTVPERLRTDPLMMPYYTGHVFPMPQKAEYRDEFLSMANVAIVVGKDVEEPGALIEVLTERITRYGGQVAVVAVAGAEHTAVVSLGDTDLARQAKEIPAVPDKEQGYIIDMTRAGGKPLIILKGRDRLGLLWSIASLMQLIHWRDGQTLARAATVVDYPTLPRRGVILDGKSFFYPGRDRKGNITGYPDTDLALRKNRLFLLVCKINEPFYNPLTGADCYDHNWKQPDKMPADAHIEEDIAAMGQNLSPLGITWWGGISPHSAGASSPEELAHKVSGDEESVNGLLYFGRLMEKAGGHLSIILDDVRFPLSPYDQEHFDTARLADTWFITRVMAQLKKEFSKARLLVCPPFYFGPVGGNPYGEDRDEYLKTIGEEWAPEIEVFWTGPQVNGPTLAAKEYFDWWMGLTKRKPYFWQNANAFSCHLFRRHYPTDYLGGLGKSSWEGLFDVLGWYGFNGNDIARMCVTDALSSDFMWNPQAYGKDKVKAIRSVHEAAEKFIGEGSWDLLQNVATPLYYFDAYEESKDKEKQAGMMREAARTYDVMEAKRDEVYSAFNILQEHFPASMQHWSVLGSFIGVANWVYNVKADPGLRIYRTVVEQRIQAKKAGDFVPDREVFFAAIDMEGGFFQEVSMDDLVKKKLEPARVLDGSKCQVAVSFPLTGEQVAAACEVLVKGRQNANAGRMTLTLNGKPVFDAKAPFGKLESTTVRFPVPTGLLVETNNVLAISLVIEEGALGAGDDLDGTGIGSGPPLALNYAVLKCRPGTQDGEK